MAFRTRYGNYEFVVMSSHLIKATSTFIDFMNRVFRNYLDYFVIFFIDDNLVYSKSEEDHKSHLRIQLQLLTHQKLFSKFRNSKVWQRFVTFLVHIVSSVVIEVDPNNTKAVKNWPRPLNPMDFQ